MWINKITLYFKRFSEHNVNFVMDLSGNSEKFKSWHTFKTECSLNHKCYIQWFQLTDAIPKAWKKLFKIILTIMVPS